MTPTCAILICLCLWVVLICGGFELFRERLVAEHGLGIGFPIVLRWWQIARTRTAGSASGATRTVPTWCRHLLKFRNALLWSRNRARSWRGDWPPTRPGLAIRITERPRYLEFRMWFALAVPPLSVHGVC
jgi:hypothetical protein